MAHEPAVFYFGGDVKSKIFRLLRFILGGISLCLIFSVLSQYFSRFMIISTTNGVDTAFVSKLAIVILPLSVVAALVVAIPHFWFIRREEQVSFSLWSAIIGFFVHLFIKYGGIVNLLLMVLGNPFYLLFASLVLIAAYVICFITMAGMFNFLNRRFPKTLQKIAINVKANES